MLQLDVLSSFAICGAGALAGAALVRPSLAQDELGVQALGLLRGGLAVLGLALLQPLALERPLPLWSQAIMAAGCLAALVVLSWAFAALAGARASRLGLWASLVGVVAITLAAVPLGTPGVTWVCAWGLAILSTLMVWMVRRIVLRPRDLHERLFGMVLALTLPTYWLRASYTLTWSGRYEDHLLYMPPVMVTPYALMYGVLPILVLLLLFNVLNARLQQRLHERAMTDHLTGAMSRHALAEGAGPLITASRTHEGSLAVIMVDLDHFKRINDELGHAAGDRVLQHVARLLRAQLRGEALLARYGGEEFVALVPVNDLVIARRVAERLRQVLLDEPWSDLVGGLERVTISVGLTLLAGDESFERALARADEALYRAKNAGRNQVQVALAAA